VTEGSGKRNTLPLRDSRIRKELHTAQDGPHKKAVRRGRSKGFRSASKGTKNEQKKSHAGRGDTKEAFDGRGSARPRSPDVEGASTNSKA